MTFSEIDSDPENHPFFDYAVFEENQPVESEGFWGSRAAVILLVGVMVAGWLAAVYALLVNS